MCSCERLCATDTRKVTMWQDVFPSIQVRGGAPVGSDIRVNPLWILHSPCLLSLVSATSWGNRLFLFEGNILLTECRSYRCL